MDWDNRYAGQTFLFGTEPAAFLLSHAHQIGSGDRVLCVADGEGRNSVYLAERGAQVVAWDASAVAVDKAVELARTRDVSIDLFVSNAETYDWPASEFDAVVAIFVQFAAPDLRSKMFAGMKRAVRPGGVILLHGYTPTQLEYGTGGPPRLENLYTESLLAAAFEDWELLVLSSYDAVIEEGTGHSGRSALVDLVARKPEQARRGA